MATGTGAQSSENKILKQKNTVQFAVKPPNSLRYLSKRDTANYIISIQRTPLRTIIYSTISHFAWKDESAPILAVPNLNQMSAYI